MKVCHVVLLSLVFVFALTGCKNRFEEYEPYSTFDERMAAADRPAMTPDDQMPQGIEDPYAYNNVQGYGGGYSSSSDDQVRMSSRSGGSSYSGSGDAEVPFSESRGRKGMNLGAM